MMLYPSVQKLTAGEYNRYALAVATAKGARLITDRDNRSRQALEEAREAGDRFQKDSKTEDDLLAPGEKPVSIAIRKIDSGDFKVVLPAEEPEDD